MIRRKRKKVKHDLTQVAELAEAIYQTPPPPDAELKLSAISERDKNWDVQRNHTADVADVYNTAEFAKYHKRMQDCSSFLEFAIDSERGLLLKRSYFCHVRNCPVCQWRKSLYWKARAYDAFDALETQYPTHRWLFLTLTVQNCHIADLRATLKQMRDAFKRMTKRKEFAQVDGWIRTTEVTRDKKRSDTHAHPHFHCILMVKSDYFNKGNYLSTMDWVRLWQSVLNVSYMPNIDIRVVKSKSSKSGIRSAIAETLKYAVKPSDMLGSNTQNTINFQGQTTQANHVHFWFYEYTRQTHKMRFIATGGLLKDVLKEDVKDKDMISTSDEQSDNEDKRRLHFTYFKKKRSYIYQAHLNT